MKLENKTYDLAKWLVLIFLPALAVLFGGLGDLYAWTNSVIIVATINLTTIFLGSILQISSQNYYNEHNPWGGGSNGPNYT